MSVAGVWEKMLVCLHVNLCVCMYFCVCGLCLLCMLMTSRKMCFAAPEPFIDRQVWLHACPCINCLSNANLVVNCKWFWTSVHVYVCDCLTNTDTTPSTLCSAPSFVVDHRRLTAVVTQIGSSQPYFEGEA